MGSVFSWDVYLLRDDLEQVANWEPNNEPGHDLEIVDQEEDENDG